MGNRSYRTIRSKGTVRFTYRNVLDAGAREGSEPKDRIARDRTTGLMVDCTDYCPDFGPYSEHIRAWWIHQQMLKHFALLRKMERLERDRRKGKVFKPNRRKPSPQPETVEMTDIPRYEPTPRQVEPRLRFILRTSTDKPVAVKGFRPRKDWNPKAK